MISPDCATKKGGFFGKAATPFLLPPCGGVDFSFWRRGENPHFSLFFQMMPSSLSNFAQRGNRSMEPLFFQTTPSSRLFPFGFSHHIGGRSRTPAPPDFRGKVGGKSPQKKRLLSSLAGFDKEEGARISPFQGLPGNLEIFPRSHLRTPGIFGMLSIQYSRSGGMEDFLRFK